MNTVVLSDFDFVEIYKRVQDEGLSVAGLPCVRFGRAVIEAYEKRRYEIEKESFDAEITGLITRMKGM